MPKSDSTNNIQQEFRQRAFVQLGRSLSTQIASLKSGENKGLKALITQARIENPWFTESNVITAIENWCLALETDSINKWLSPYLPELTKEHSSRVIGLVNAGNIPLVGLHDMVSVLICGYSYLAKNATGDSVLLPYIANLLIEIEPLFRDKIHFVPKLEKMDAVIATGNNNSARYFEYYFKKYPHIIRMNRNGVAILTGDETVEDLKLLGKDIFSYFGLGCRNVSKLYVPRGYNFDKFFESIYEYNEVMMHSKYMNNFDYHNSVFLLKRIPFLQNGFLIIREENHIASPVSVLHYEFYDDNAKLNQHLQEQLDLIQCIVAKNDYFKNIDALKKIAVTFGQTQTPALWDYADGVDTIKFLCGSFN
jgi:hypothetical protein